MIKRMLILIAMLAVIAASCGGDDDTVSAADCEVGEVDGDLDFYNWTDYMDPDLITAFQDEYGVSVTESFYDSNETMLSQIQGGVSYDVIVPSDYMISIMISEGLLVELNKDAIPNFENMDPQFTTQPYDDGAKYSAAYQYGTTGLGVNIAATGEDIPHSWALIFDPDLTANFPGGVSVLNDPRETMGAALEYLGYSLNDVNKDHLDEAVEVIKKAKEHIAQFDSDQAEEALVAGEVSVAQGYSGGMIVEMLESENPDDFIYILPEEGATLWIDNMAIPTNAESVCTAHTFIDFLLDAENGAQLTNWNYYGSPNAASVPFLDQEVIDFYEATSSAKLEVIEDQGDYEINYTDALAEAKS